MLVLILLRRSSSEASLWPVDSSDPLPSTFFPSFDDSLGSLGILLKPAVIWRKQDQIRSVYNINTVSVDRSEEIYRSLDSPVQNKIQTII